MMTPLLDWTWSPYVAAFWGFMDRLEKLRPLAPLGPFVKRLPAPVLVWEFVPPTVLPAPDAETGKSLEYGCPPELQIVLEPRFEGVYRQKAQQGLFTRLTHDIHVDLEAYLVSKGFSGCLHRYEINGSEIDKALCDLHMMNINYVTLFPDAEGAARQANILPMIEGMQYWAGVRDRIRLTPTSPPGSTAGEAPTVGP